MILFHNGPRLCSTEVIFCPEQRISLKLNIAIDDTSVLEHLVSPAVVMRTLSVTIDSLFDDKILIERQISVVCH